MKKVSFNYALMAALLFLLSSPVAAQRVQTPQQSTSEGALKVDGWPTVTPEGEEFSIQMPVRPIVTVRSFTAGKGKPTYVERTYVVKGPRAGHAGNEVQYIVTSIALPQARSGATAIRRAEFDSMMYTLQQSFESVLDTYQQRMVLTTPREVFNGLHTGREYAIELDYGAPKGRVRFFATGQHIYLVGYIDFSYYGISFLDSFKLKNDNRLVIQDF